MVVLKGQFLEPQMYEHDIKNTLTLPILLRKQSHDKVHLVTVLELLITIIWSSSADGVCPVVTKL